MSNQQAPNSAHQFKHGPKPVIGLVGGIGAGKSTAAGCFALRGGLVIDADALGHEALRQPEVLAAAAGRWGNGVCKPDGSLDRRELGRVVFGNSDERRALEGMVFPWITARCAAAIESAMTHPAVPFVVVDAAVLFEAGWHANMDRIAYVDAPRDVRLARLAARSGWTEADLAAREAAQWPADEKRARADEILVNDAGPVELQEHVDRLLGKWGVRIGPAVEGAARGAPAPE
ncbi:dephospho-CoA kinase [Gemmata sp.]|uniref:dephospho-CoA kinase n=1 Tax=Gemmata sp. TaxID=1914242 RepID=UPI003F71F256